MDHLSHDPVEHLAALILLVGGAIFIAVGLRARSGRRGSGALAAARPAGGSAARRSFAVNLAGLSAGAAVIHLVAAPAHYAEIGDLASGFVLAAAFQALWIRWLLAGPSHRTIAIGIAGNLAIVAAWVWSRTVGLPIGELAGMPEPIGFPDGASVAFELLLVGGLVIASLVDRLAPGRSVVRRANLAAAASIAIVPVLGLVLVLTSLATVAIASGHDHGPADAHAADVHAAHP